MESTQTADSQRAVSAPDDLTVAEVIERLVHADPDPFVCLRELVQNAIDANGREIDVGVVFEPDAAHGEPSPDDLGLAELAVEDRGDGMGREVIEGRLVRLFASVGDVEPDRIGHLGTGFVTVFALDPTLVVVDSSWRGEHWRVLFDRDRGYSLRRRPRASFGTAVRVFKRTRRAEAEALRAAAREALTRWCKHAPATIRFEGELISRRLELDAPCTVTIRDDDGELVVGHPEGGVGSRGLYRSGLTLEEGDDALFPGVSFKVSSKRLHRSMTCEVIRDVTYERCLERVREAIDLRLSEQVFTMLEAHVWSSSVADPEAHAARGEYLYDAAIWHVRRSSRLPLGAEDRAAFRSPAGLAISLGTVRRALERRGVVFYQPERSPLTDAVEDLGHLVIRLGADSPGRRLLDALDGQGRVLSVAERYCMPLKLTAAELEPWRPLTRALAQLVVDAGGEITGVEVGRFAYEGSSIADAPAITQEHYGDLSERAKARGRGRQLLTRLQALVLNGDLPELQALAKLARGEPEFAGYQLARLLFIGARLDPRLDASLARLTVERRWKRTNR